MSFLNSAFTFLPFFYFSRISTDAKILIVTDHCERLQIDFTPLPCSITFAIPKNCRAENKTIHDDQLLEWGNDLQFTGKQFDTIIIDLAAQKGSTAVSKLRPLLSPTGRLIWLDWAASRDDALRNLGKHLRRTIQPDDTSQIGAHALHAANLSPVWHFLLEPDLQKPRFLIQPGIQKSLPAQSESSVKKWLARKGGFYLQARHKVIVAQATNAAQNLLSPVETVVSKITGLHDLTQIRRTIRRIYISTTNVLMIQFQHQQQHYFLRFPFTALSSQRVGNQNTLTGFLVKNGISYVPKPLNISGLPFPVYGETGQPGQDIEKHFSKAPLSEAQIIFEAALQKITEIHRRFGEIHTFDEALFDQYLHPRLEAISRRCPTSKNVVESIGKLLRQNLMGKRVLQSVCHGDFKIGNCLFDENNAIMSIIDWDMGEKKGITLVDTTSLFAKSLRLRHGYSLADLPGNAADLPDDFLPIFDQYFSETKTDAIPTTAAIVFYWLDRVYKQFTFDAHLKESWIQKNVVEVIPILEKLC